VQSKATDVIEVGITEEQAKKIAAACDRTVEIANGDQDCAQAMRDADWRPHPCRTSELCLHVYDVSNVAELGHDRIIEIVDDRPGESLCDSGPDRVCLRVGVTTAAVLDRIVTTSLSTTSSLEVTTSTPTSTETTATSSSVTTSSSTPEVTSPPTTTS
jgi:hypothetical protein